MQQKITLSRAESFSHYCIVFFLLLVPLFTTYSLFQIYVLKNYTGVRKPHQLMIGYVWIIPAIFFYLVQKRRLKFTVINKEVDIATFKKAIYNTSIKLNWKLQSETGDHVVAIRQGGLSTGGSWGEMITIIRRNKSILINSICDPDNIISFASFGWNRKNVKIFLNELEILNAD